MNRRDLLRTAAVIAGVAALDHLPALAAPETKAASTKPATTKKSDVPDDVVWHDVRDWGVEGRGFNDTDAYFDRLPKRAKEIVRPEVWNLSHDTAGMSAHFETDATNVYVRYSLTSAELAMPHMPATGVSGMDIYAKNDDAWRWAGTIHPRSRDIAAPIAQGLPPGRRAYQINLPLYNGVKSMEIGVRKGASFMPIEPRKEKPILVYGTSITQGGCASRPGMAFVAILGRRLNRPTLNFGFSGNGRTEADVARVLAELDPAVFVIDTLANTSPEQLKERIEPLVKILRDAHATTPILLLGERPIANIPLAPKLDDLHQEKESILKEAFERLAAAGDKSVHYHAGADVIGVDGEGTVDGSHPTDLGMMRYADALGPDLHRLLR
jgi:lysophospholipase L1-like esterase